MPQAGLAHSSWQGSLRDLANIIYQIRRSHAFGRLSLRNTERLSVIHLYFRAGKLVHIVGNRGNVRVLLNDLQSWSQGLVRFERGVTTNESVLDDEHERFLDEVLTTLNRRGVVTTPQTPRIVDSSIIASRDARQLIAPWEWYVLIEAMRRVSFAVARLVGPQEALTALQDILDDCSSAFPAFACLRIDPTGYLHVVDISHLNQMSREHLIEGFAALIATCQYFCSPVVGEKEAHRLIVQALQDIGPALSGLGVFQVDNRLLSSGNSS